MPIMEVTLEQLCEGQSTINRWNYLAGGTPAAVSHSFGLMSALGAIPDGGVYPPGGLVWLIANIQTPPVQFIEMTVRNVYGDTDFYTYPFQNEPLQGQYSDTMAPIFNAIGYRTNRVRQSIRRGQKRFVGVPEGQVSGGGQWDAGYITGYLNPVAAAMSAVLSYDDEGNTLTYAPIVVAKEQYIPDPARPDRVAYKYYDTEVEQLEHVAQGIVWSVRSYVSHQTTRRYGGA